MPEKFNINDKVYHFGTIGTIRAIKMGGYLVDFPKAKRQFVYESELTSANHLFEDDRRKNVWNVDTD